MHILTFNLLIMIIKPLQTAWNQSRHRVTQRLGRLVRFQAMYKYIDRNLSEADDNNLFSSVKVNFVPSKKF